MRLQSGWTNRGCKASTSQQQEQRFFLVVILPLLWRVNWNVSFILICISLTHLSTPPIFFLHELKRWPGWFDISLHFISSRKSVLTFYWQVSHEAKWRWYLEDEEDYYTSLPCSSTHFVRLFRTPHSRRTSSGSCRPTLQFVSSTFVCFPNFDKLCSVPPIFLKISLGFWFRMISSTKPSTIRYGSWMEGTGCRRYVHLESQKRICLKL